MKWKRILYKIYLWLLLIAPVVLLLLPIDFFDGGQSICVSTLLFDQECYGCGITRGVHHLIHLDFNAADEYNKLSFLVLPVMIYIWVMELWRIRRILKNQP